MSDETNKQYILDKVFSTAKDFTTQKGQIQNLLQELDQSIANEKMIYGSGSANSGYGTPNIAYFLSKLLKILSEPNSNQ